MKFPRFALTILMFAAGLNSASAQLKKPGFIAGANVMYAMPSGSFHDTHSYGYGAEAFAGASLGKTYFVATMGVSNYKAFNENVGDLKYTPIKAGVRRYFLLKKIHKINPYTKNNSLAKLKKSFDSIKIETP